MKKINEPAEQRASDILYDEIASSRNSLRRENIRLIKLACDQMEKDRIAISAADVVRRCGADGPAYSTVSNKGSPLGEYVRQRIAEQASPQQRGASVNSSIADAMLDPVLQAQVRDKESAVRWLTKQNAGLRSLLKSLRPGVDIDRMLRGEPADETPKSFDAPQRASIADNHELKGALLKLMDHLIGSRQYKELRGRLTINGKVVLDARALQVFTAACGLSEEEWSARYGSNSSGASNG